MFRQSQFCSSAATTATTRTNVLLLSLLPRSSVVVGEGRALFSTSCKLLYFFSKIVGPLLLEKKVPTTLSLKRHWKNNSIIFHVRSFRPETEKVIVFIKCQIKRDCSRRYRRLLLKLDKQISGTIYQQQTRHRAWRGGDASLYADFHH